MTRWATLAIGFLAFCSFPVTGPAQAQSGEGWITLFDGKNLDHWQGDGNGGRMGDLRTAREQTSFGCPMSRGWRKLRLGLQL